MSRRLPWLRLPWLRLPWLLGSSLACVLAMASGARAAEVTPRNALLATSKGNHTLAIIDPATDRVVARMPIGPDPHEVIASDDGRTAYVSNMGGGSSLHRIDVLDLVGQRALEPVDTGALTGLHGLAVSPGKLWFTAQGAMAIARLDLASRQIDWIMGTGQSWTHMLVVTPGERDPATSGVGPDCRTDGARHGRCGPVPGWQGDLDGLLRVRSDLRN